MLGPGSSGDVDFARKLSDAKTGSKEQQAELLETFRDYLRQLAAQTVGVENGQAQLSVSDLVQSAIIDACDGFEKCRAAGKEEFKAWLRQILMNDILSRYRFLRRQKRDVAKEAAINGDLALASEADSPVAEAQRKEDEKLLVAAIEKLAPDHQTVIRLRHHDKLTFVEIGKRMDRSSDAVRMLWNRAVEELSKVL